jgi:AcrR family transcriptional regulator
LQCRLPIPVPWDKKKFIPNLPLIHMASSSALALDRNDHQALLDPKADPATPARVALRAAIILELASGANRPQVAAKLGISVPTTALWQRRFEQGGIAQLRDSRRSGRPRRVVRSARPDMHLSEPELDRLIAAARRTISRRGFSATRVADIAAEANVSPATIHYYFKTKNEILVRALLWAGEQLLPPIVDDADSNDAITLIVRYIESTIPYPGVQRDEYLLEIDLWSNVRLYPELLPAWEDYEEQWLAHVTELIDLGMRTGAFTSQVPPAELAERLVALTDGLSAQAAINASRMPPQRVRELIFRFASEQLGVPLHMLEERAASWSAPTATPSRAGVLDE